MSDRIASLGRAHDFARPHSEQSRPIVGEVTLHGLLENLLAPYQNVDGTRIRITGDDPSVDDRGATPLALLFHERATNAAKYGALSVPDGRVELRSTVETDRILITWQEVEGLPLTGQPYATGFGSQLVRMSVEQKMLGSNIQRWEPDGLTVEVQLPLGSVARSTTA